MRSQKFFVCVLLGMFFLLSACQNEKGKDDFSGVSELISDRNKARYEAAENLPKQSSSSKKITANKTNPSKSIEKPKEELSSIVLYEEDVEILGSKSGKTLANGVAYINKQGQIVKIKIVRE